MTTDQPRGVHDRLDEEPTKITVDSCATRATPSWSSFQGTPAELVASRSTLTGELVRD